MTRKKHPNKHIEDAIREAENKGWRFVEGKKSAHCFGRLLCKHANRDGCMMSVYSTPRSNENHATQILRYICKCTHTNGDE